MSCSKTNIENLPLAIKYLDRLKRREELTQANVHYIKKISNGTLDQAKDLLASYLSALSEKDLTNLDKTPESKVKDLLTSWSSRVDQVKKAYAEGRDIVVSSYIVGTKVNTSFLVTLERFVQSCNGILVIIPQRYKNPSSLAEKYVQDDEVSFIDPLIQKYILCDRVHLPGVTILADVRVQPTAAKPCTGLKALSEGNSLILGHATAQLESIPRMMPDSVKVITTTGSVSIKPPLDSLAAKKLENDMILGAVIISNRQEFHLRRIHADSKGVFYDLGRKYSQKTDTVSAPLYSTWGDIHFGQEDKDALLWAMKTCSDQGVDKIILNDSFDGQTVNPHAFTNVQRYKVFKSVTEEVNYHNECITQLSAFFKVYRIDSNHDDMLSRWAKTSLMSSAVSMEDVKLMYKVYTEGHRYVLEGMVIPGGTVLDSFMLTHGHESVNGGRPSLETYATFKNRVIGHHVHSPKEYRGQISNGCLCQIEQDYTKGPFTGWAHAIVQVYPDHKAQLLIKP